MFTFAQTFQHHLDVSPLLLYRMYRKYRYTNCYLYIQQLSLA